MKLHLETLQQVEFMFQLHSDHSTVCNGYKNLQRWIKKEIKQEACPHTVWDMKPSEGGVLVRCHLCEKPLLKDV